MPTRDVKRNREGVDERVNFCMDRQPEDSTRSHHPLGHGWINERARVLIVNMERKSERVTHERAYPPTQLPGQA